MGPNAGVAATVCIAGLLLFFAGVLTCRQTRRFVRLAGASTGTVADLACDEYVSPEGDCYYAAVVQFPDASGKLVSVRWSCGTHPAPYRLGQPVAVLYDQHDPSRAVARSFFALWYHVVALLGVGAALAGGGAVLLLTGA